MKNLYKKAIVRLLAFFACIFSLGTSQAQEFMAANLYIVDASGATLMDGNLTEYNSAYSNSIDFNDIWKMTNPGVNFGISREGYDIVVERRNLINDNDSTQFKMWNMMRKNYQLRFVLKNFNYHGLTASLFDSYSRTSFPVKINDTTYYDFTVNTEPGSANMYRFQLQYKFENPTPFEVDFKQLKAERSGKNIVIDWKTLDDKSVIKYAVEYTSDGYNFTELFEMPGNQLQGYNNYQYTDLSISDAAHYYRIRSIDARGRIVYSKTVKVSALNKSLDVGVFPNPVVGKNLKLQFFQQPAGRYKVLLVNIGGESTMLPYIQVQEGVTQCIVTLPESIKSGLYILQLTGPDKNVIVKPIKVL